MYGAPDRLDRRGLAAAWLSDPGLNVAGPTPPPAAGREFGRQERELALRMWQGVRVDLRRGGR
jgi:hypothetical protein